MSEALATKLVVAGWAYMAIGFLFALVFVSAGARVVDPKTAGGSVLFRVLIIPGCAALWPLLLHKWWRANVARTLEDTDEDTR